MRKGIYLLLILLFPSIIYMLFSLGEHRVEKIGSFGSFSVSAEGDTSYAPVPNVRFIDQDGEEFSLRDLNGFPVVVDVISYPCDESCKKKGVTLVNYLNELSAREKWKVLSIVTDQNVSVEELKKLQEKHMPEMDNWHFVAPKDERALTEFMQYVFVETGKVSAVSELPSKDFALIDQQGVIRAFFDSRIYKENRKLEDAIKLLLQEPYLTWKEEK